jgi:molecular chaperone GrpE (heat shock protein)
MWRDYMASIVYWKNKKNGYVYAYSSESYWDKEKQSPRSRRTYLGRVDPDTGEIIKGTRKAKAQEKVIKEKNIQDIENDVIRDLRGQVDHLREEISRLEGEVREYKSKYQRAGQLAQAIIDIDQK